MVGSNCDLKTLVQYLGYPLPLQTGGLKTTLLGRLRNLTATLTAYIFGMKNDRQSVKCIDNYKRSPTSSQNELCHVSYVICHTYVMNFGPQTASNWTGIFAHPM